MANAIQKTAEISPCGRYRYSLTRQWDAGAHLLPVIMLNPSTADAEHDDPTIRRCMAFARREQFGGIRVMNLFAFRATSPAVMMAEANPIGPDCSAHLEMMLAESAKISIPVLVAWGTNGAHRRRDEAVKLSAKAFGADLVSLGVTAAGHPRHPLYVKGDQTLVALPAA